MGYNYAKMLKKIAPFRLEEGVPVMRAIIHTNPVLSNYEATHKL
jgi:hypothetical protein